MNKLSMTTRHALSMRSVLATACVAALMAGCSTMAEPNAALDRAHASYHALQGDPQAKLAPAETLQAGEAVRTADTAWSQRENARTVDHLAYLAQQRIAIARETGHAKALEQAATASKASAEADKARTAADTSRAATDRARADSDRAHTESDRAQREAMLARQDTRDKSAELAQAQAGAQQDKARATDLEMQLKDLHAKQTERGDVITLGDVQFDSNQARLRPGGGRDLDKLADFLKRHPKRTAQIEGFTDSQGSESANLDLSQRRAETIRDALVEHGVPAARLSAHGHGEADPVATNGTAAGRQMNRRVEIVLPGDDEASGR